MQSPTPEIIALVQACSGQLKPIGPDEYLVAFTPPQPGTAGAQPPTPQQLDAVYATAWRLCDEGNFRFASALALHLVGHMPRDPRFSFMAATCMQRLGMHAQAARFYCVSLVSGGASPAALYRLGECLAALGDKVNAETALEAALDVTRDMGEETRQLQMLAQSLIESLKRGAGGSRRPTVGPD